MPWSRTEASQVFGEMKKTWGYCLRSLSVEIQIEWIYTNPDSMESGITYSLEVSIQWTPPTTLDL